MAEPEHPAIRAQIGLGMVQHGALGFGNLDIRALLAFLFPLVFLFFGPTMPALVAVYLILLAIQIDARFPVKGSILAPILIAGGLEMVYRYRAGGDSLLQSSLTPIVFAAAYVACTVADVGNRGRKAYLWGNFALLGLIAVQRVIGHYLAPTYYSSDTFAIAGSAYRMVGPGIPDPNTFALVHLAFLFPLACSRGLSRNQSIAVLMLLLAVPMYSLSRTALAVVVLLLAFGLPRSLPMSSSTRGALAIFLVAVSIVALIVIGQSEGRLDASDSLETKQRYAEYGLKVIREEITLFGVPDNDHLKVSGLGLASAPSFHNTYLSLTAAAGLIGLLGLLVVVASPAWRFAAEDALPALLVMNALFLTTGYLIGIGYVVMVSAKN